MKSVIGSLVLSIGLKTLIETCKLKTEIVVWVQVLLTSHSVKNVRIVPH